MSSRPSKPSSDLIQDLYWLQDILQVYVTLSVWVIQWTDENRLVWMDLTPQHEGRVSPVHFEKFFSREAERDAYYFKSLQKLQKEGKGFSPQHRGFYDIFLPIEIKGKKRSALYANYFLRAPADLETLRQQWQALSGRVPTGSDPDFLRYVRMALSLPVYEDRLFRGVWDFLEALVSFLGGKLDKEPFHEKVDDLRRKVFAQELPNEPWFRDAIGTERLIPAPWDWYADRQLALWMREELGITRIPNQVIAVMPLIPSGGQARGVNRDPAEALVLQDRVQRACRRFAAKLPETVGGKLGDYGALFLTSTDPGRSQVQARLQLRDMGHKIQAMIRKEFGMRSVVGIGRPLPVGSVLAPSLREAVVALHLCVQRGSDQQFYETLEKKEGEASFSPLHRTEREMMAAFERDAWEDLKAGSERFSREVLEYAGGDLALLQALYLSALYRLLDRAGTHWALDPEVSDPLRKRFAQGMAEAGSIHRSMGVFLDALDELRNLSHSPREGAQNLRVEKILSFLNEHFNEPLTLTQVAKRSGFSVPLFCRVFKKRTGQTFSVYLNRLRIEEAKKLLRGSELALGRVGQACGFRNAHHFIRNFKKLVRRTPGEYRVMAR